MLHENFLFQCLSSALVEMRSVGEKCSEKSEKFTIDAKEFQENSKFSDAILSLNKALCYATTDEDRALIYISRGKIYYELKLYKECLENFDLARDQGLVNEFRDVEENCKNLMKQNEQDHEGNSKFFSITLPVNPKIPFIADCLKLQESWKFGRGVVTDRNIKTGEVLVVEEPFFKMLNKDVRHKKCAHCLKSNHLCLIPCDKYCVSSE
jgi:tetratricopeptide (TPR) repeat protein